MTLQEYSFSIKHRLIVNYGNAEGLPSTNDNSYSHDNLNCVTAMSPGYNLHQAELNDSHFSKIIEIISAGLP